MGLLFMQIVRKSFGKTASGEEVSLFTLDNGRGSFVNILDYGCTVQSIVVPDRTGTPTDVCLGYDTIEDYEKNPGYLGAVVGRVANRIGGARFSLNGIEYLLAANNGPNHLHGGIKGFDKFVWDAEETSEGLRFSRTSPDGEEGYPGTLEVAVTVLFNDRNELSVHYEASSDADTAVNLTNHSYFSLDGSDSVLGHALKVYADAFTENDENTLPTGKIINVKGTPFDFTEPKEIGCDIGRDDGQLRICGGYDHNFILRSGPVMHPAAELYAPESGIGLAVSTTKPGMQVYTANFLEGAYGKGGRICGRRSAVCLETQYFPDALNHSEFPSPILRKGEKYDHTTVYRFFIDK